MKNPRGVTHPTQRISGSAGGRRRSRVVVIVQARTGSTRLPGKVLMDLGGKTVLERVLERAAAVPGVSQVVLAVPKGPADARLRASAARLPGVTLHAGSEDDVLDRFYRAAQRARADVVLRVTADCPLLDPAVSGRVLQALLRTRADYAVTKGFPDGLDTEAFRFSALETAWRRAKARSEREHVTPYLRAHPELFKAAAVVSASDLSGLRWTLDEPADLEFLRRVYGRLNGSRPAGMDAVLAVLKKDPGLSALNRGIIMNEGYYRSLLKEPIKPRPLRLARSKKLMARALKLIPGGSQTFSKAPNQFVRGVAPLLLERGKGSRVWDVDGNEFLETTMSLAPVVLGYADPDVDAAAARQLARGTILSQPHPLEARVARAIVDLVPCAEMARFGKSGSDATAGAVRLARAYTGRDLIAACGYHGWQDWYIGTTTRAGGVPQAVRRLTKTFEYNKIETLAKLFKERRGEFAAVIMEPIGVVEPLPGFLEEVAALTRKNGALLIFDEVVTGFRLALGGAQEYFKVVPDLACLGKALANGFPLSALTGRAKYMRLIDELFFSFTFGGELLSLAAAEATLKKLSGGKVIPHLWAQGRRLKDGYNALSRAAGLSAYTQCVGLAPHTVATFKDARGGDWWDLKSLVQQECVRRGYLFMGIHNPCYALKEADVDRILRVYASALPAAAEAVRSKSVRRRLRGAPVEPVFRRP